MLGTVLGARDASIAVLMMSELCFVEININTHRHGSPAPPSTYFLKLVLWVVTTGLSTLGLRVLILVLKFSLSL